MPERPFLTARWTELLLLNFEVPVVAIASLAPPGTEPDLYEGRAYISIVGFRFQRVRLLGVPIPGHTRFDEINLRYYVNRTAGGELRRGVVFGARSCRAAAWRLSPIASTTKTTSRARCAAPSPRTTPNSAPATRSNTPGKAAANRPSLSGRGRATTRRPATAPRWNRLAARMATPLTMPPRGSLDEFIVEHYWGYVRNRDGRTCEYRVAHPPWRVARADHVTWDCDLASNYEPPLAEYLAASPTAPSSPMAPPSKSSAAADYRRLALKRHQYLWHHDYIAELTVRIRPRCRRKNPIVIPSR